MDRFQPLFAFGLVTACWCRRHASAARAGLVPQVTKMKSGTTVSGASGSLSFAVYARQLNDGVTDVELVTQG